MILTYFIFHNWCVTLLFHTKYYTFQIQYLHLEFDISFLIVSNFIFHPRGMTCRILYLVFCTRGFVFEIVFCICQASMTIVWLLHWMCEPRTCNIRYFFLRFKVEWRGRILLEFVANYGQNCLPLWRLKELSKYLNAAERVFFLQRGE